VGSVFSRSSRLKESNMSVTINIKKKISVQQDRYGNIIKTEEENMERRGNNKVQKRSGTVKESPTE
jgi:hypothetical protein